MNKKTLLALWGGMFILCAGLGFIREPAGAVRGLLTALSAGFFIPPGLLVYWAARQGDRNTLALVRGLSLASLGLTLALLVANFLSVLRSEAVGDALYGLLTIVSSPMVCSGYWVLSLFLWACLLTASWRELRKKRG